MSNGNFDDGELKLQDIDEEELSELSEGKGQNNADFLFDSATSSQLEIEENKEDDRQESIASQFSYKESM